MQNDSQTPQDGQGARPDYSFIDEYSAPPPKNKMNLKVIIIVVGIVLTLLLAVGGAFLSEQRGSLSSKVNGNSESSVFVARVLADQTSEAYAMLNPELKVIYDTEDEFKNGLAKGIKQLVAGGICQPVGIDRGIDTDSFIYRCDAKGTIYWMGLGIQNLGKENELVHKTCSITHKELKECR